MGRPKKPITPVEAISQILAMNIARRLAPAFPAAKNETDQFAALGRRSGVGKETIRTIMKGERSPTVVTLDAIARALGTTADELLRIRAQGEEEPHHRAGRAPAGKAVDTPRMGSE